MEVLTIKEVSKMVKATPMTIYNWRKSGDFPEPKQCVQRGKLLWLLQDIEKWLKGEK